MGFLSLGLNVSLGLPGIRTACVNQRLVDSFVTFRTPQLLYRIAQFSGRHVNGVSPLISGALVLKPLRVGNKPIDFQLFPGKNDSDLGVAKLILLLFFWAKGRQVAEVGLEIPVSLALLGSDRVVPGVNLVASHGFGLPIPGWEVTEGRPMASHGREAYVEFLEDW